MIFDEVDNVVETVQETPEQPQPAPPAQPEQAQLSQKEMNMRKAWEKAERAERERDELYRRLQQMEAQQQQLKAVPEDDEIGIGNDDIVEGKHIKKMYSQQRQEIKELKRMLTQNQQQTAEQTAEARLKSQYPDFDSVVSKANIESLREVEPELAATLNASTDLYSKAVSAYKLIKKLGIHQEDSYVADRARAQTNANKPKPLASVSPQQGDSPLSHANAFANGLTEDLKAQLLKEMMNARRSH